LLLSLSCCSVGTEPCAAVHPAGRPPDFPGKHGMGSCQVWHPPRRSTPRAVHSLASPSLPLPATHTTCLHDSALMSCELLRVWACSIWQRFVLAGSARGKPAAVPAHRPPSRCPAAQLLVGLCIAQQDMPDRFTALCNLLHHTRCTTRPSGDQTVPSSLLAFPPCPAAPTSTSPRTIRSPPPPPPTMPRWDKDGFRQPSLAIVHWSLLLYPAAACSACKPHCAAGPNGRVPPDTASLDLY